MTVVTNESGDVVSTYRPPERPGENDPVLHIHAGPGYEVQEVDLPETYGQIESPEELHTRVAEHLKSQGH